MEIAFFAVLFLGIIVVAVVLPIVAMVRIQSLTDRVTRLTADVVALQQALRLRGSVPRPSQVEAAPPTPKASLTEPTPSAEEPRLPVEPSQSAPRPIPRPAITVPVPKPKKDSTAVEAMLGGRVLNRIGAVAVFFGAAYFFKWAVDNNMISETLRVVIGLITGIGIVSAASWMRKSSGHIIAQGVAALGIGILYLSVYAAYNWYSLIPVLAGYLAMLAVTMAAVWRSHVHHSVFLAAFTSIAGFLIPAWLATPEPNTAALFLHVALIDLAIVGIVMLRGSWQPLYFIAIVGTVVWQWLWYVNIESLENERITAAFMACVAIAISVLVVPAHRARSLPLSRPFGAPVWAIAVVALSCFLLFVMEGAPVWISDTMLLAVAIATYWIGRTDGPDSSSALVKSAAGVAAFLIVIGALYNHPNVSERLCIVALASTITTLLARRDRLYAPQALALGVLALLMLAHTWFELVETLLDRRSMAPVLNLRFFASVLASAALWYVLTPSRLLAHASSIVRYLRYVPVIYLAIVLAREVHLSFAVVADALPRTVLGFHDGSHIYWLAQVAAAATFTIVVGLAPLLSRWIKGFDRTILPLVTVLLGSIALVLVAMEFEPLSAYTLIFNFRVGMTLVACVAIAVGWRYALPKAKLSSAAIVLPWVGILILTFAVATMEAATPWMAAMDRLHYSSDVVLALSNSMALAISVTWVVYAALLLFIGFVTRVRPTRFVGIAVFGIAIIKVFVFDLQYLETPYRILSFIALGVVLLLVSFVYSRLKKQL